MKLYHVKLDKWCDPVLITKANDALQASKLAVKYYPTCDCCEEKTHVEWVKETKDELVIT